MIVGMYVGVEGPSWMGAKMALANAFSDKVDFCAKYGIEIESDDWNVHFLPEEILADRGELIGFNSDQVVESLNVRISNTPPYRADWKGIVEQSFRRANLQTVHWLPGAIKERFRERGETDHRLDATLDLHQFTKIMIHTFLHHNHYYRMEWYPRDQFMIQDQVEPIPKEIWNWGIRNRVGYLRELPSELVKLNLMPRGEATVTESGIRHKGMYYSCELALQEQWFERARAFGSWKAPVAFDERNMADSINLILNNGKNYEVCHLLERESRFKGYRLEEILDLQEFEKLGSAKYETTKIQSEAELHANIEATVAEASEQTRQAVKADNKSASQRVKSSKSNRREEKERIRQAEKWNLGKGEFSKGTPSTIIEMNPAPLTPDDEELAPKLTKHQSLLNMLKNQRKG
jgi:putative transposase